MKNTAIIKLYAPIVYKIKYNKNIIKRMNYEL